MARKVDPSSKRQQMLRKRAKKSSSARSEAMRKSWRKRKQKAKKTAQLPVAASEHGYSASELSRLAKAARKLARNIRLSEISDILKLTR